MSAEERKAEIESGKRPSMDPQNFGGYHGWNSPGEPKKEEREDHRS
jgi:hypothetical protein